MSALKEFTLLSGDGVGGGGASPIKKKGAKGTYTFVTRVQGVLYKTKAPFLSGRYCPCLFHSLKAMLDLLIHAASSPRSLHPSAS